MSSTRTNSSTAADREQALARHTLRGVLVPLDGSPLAEQALAVGASFARRSGAPLHLVSVTEPVPPAVLSESPELAASYARDAAGDLERYLASVAASVRAARPGTVKTAVLSGQPSEAIASYAEQEAVDLIVLTTRGQGRAAGWLCGSVADELLTRSGTPLLLLHPGELPQPTCFGRIMIAFDGDCDHLLLNAALTLGILSPGTRYILAQVVEPEVPLLTPLARYPHHVGPAWTERQLAEADARLAELVRDLERQGIRASRIVVRGRGVAQRVLKLGREVRAECLVLGTHGLTGIDRAVLGSVAAKVLRKTDTPLLVVPLARGAAVEASQSPKG